MSSPTDRTRELLLRTYKAYLYHATMANEDRKYRFMYLENMWDQRDNIQMLVYILSGEWRDQ